MRVLYVQPLIAGYRLPVMKKLSNTFDLVTVAGLPPSARKEGFAEVCVEGNGFIKAQVHSLFRGKLLFQADVLFLSLKDVDAVLLCANPRDITYWILMLRCWLKKVSCYSHGQGLYSSANPSVLKRLMYKAMSFFSTKYVCYTELSRQSMLGAGCNPNKLTVAENSIELLSLISPDKKTFDESGILFLGRLRDGCGLNILIEAATLLRQSNPNIELHIIGGGVNEAEYKKKYSNLDWISWYGAVHDDADIAKISRKCRIACYPGDAGLSVVHYFGLSLPLVIHDKITEHCGPEPSYVEDGINGFLFEKEAGSDSLYWCLKRVWEMDEIKLQGIAKSAFSSYRDLTSPSLGDRMVKIIENGREQS